jgi:hypothetical protein
MAERDGAFEPPAERTAVDRGRAPRKDSCTGPDTVASGITMEIGCI